VFLPLLRSTKKNKKKTQASPNHLRARKWRSEWFWTQLLTITDARPTTESTFTTVPDPARLCTESIQKLENKKVNTKAFSKSWKFLGTRLILQGGYLQHVF